MFKIFPATILQDGDKKVKKPIENDWYESASNDLVVIENWVKKYGSQIMMWGIPCGSANGIIGVDIDVKNEDGFKSAELHGLNLPHTLSQRTTTGGAHYIYKLPEGMIIGNTVSTFAPAVDTRGEKGWLACYNLDNTPIADAPEWLLKPKEQFIRKDGFNFSYARQVANNILDSICEDVMQAPIGESNNVLNLKSFEAAQELISTNSLPHDEVYDRLFYSAKMRGKSDAEAKATINSGITGGLKAGPKVVCELGPVTPMQMSVQDPDSWMPERTTVAKMQDQSKLKKPQNFKDWSPLDITLVTGDGGTGKTTFALYEAVCMALNRRFMGFECLRPGSTLFLIGEDDADKTMSLLGAMCRQLNLTPEEWQIVADRIVIKKDTDMCFITKDRVGFLHPDMRALQKISQSFKFVYFNKIVVDPISSFWGSEAALNDMSKAVSRFAALLRDAVAGGVQVELINHMGKSSSQSKDMTQFAGRGGSALPSHSRINRVMRGIDANEFLELSGKVLEAEKSAMLIVVNKFSDGTPILNKPFIAIRTGHCFERADVSQDSQDQDEQRADIEYVFDLIQDERKHGKYPIKSYVVAMMQQYMSKDKVTNALNILQYRGHRDLKIKYIVNPDVTVKEKSIIFIDMSENEL